MVVSCVILPVGCMRENIPLILQTQKTEIIGMCWRNTKKEKIEIEIKVLEQVYDLIYLEIMMFELKKGYI